MISKMEERGMRVKKVDDPGGEGSSWERERNEDELRGRGQKVSVLKAA